MKYIDCFDTCLGYVNRLGFAGQGDITTKQKNLCRECDKLLQLSGQKTWYNNKFKPFYIQYKKKNNTFIIKEK
jgi:hypothetical protein